MLHQSVSLHQVSSHPYMAITRDLMMEYERLGAKRLQNERTLSRRLDPKLGFSLPLPPFTLKTNRKELPKELLFEENQL